MTRRGRTGWIGALLGLALCGGAEAQTPAAAGPRRVLIIGDSMMRLTAHSLKLALEKQPNVTARDFTSLGSGLARLDVFDWLAKADELVGEFQPDATIAWFGTNDRQPMQTAAGVVQPGTAPWDDEYARRVGALMDRLGAAPGARVLWLELPDMRDAKIQSDVDAINRIVKAEADRRPAVTFVPARGWLTRRPGTFAPYLPGPKGIPVSVRDPDGVHLSRAGADMMAERLVGILFGGAPAAP